MSSKYIPLAVTFYVFQLTCLSFSERNNYIYGNYQRRIYSFFFKKGIKRKTCNTFSLYKYVYLKMNYSFVKKIIKGLSAQNQSHFLFTMTCLLYIFIYLLKSLHNCFYKMSFNRLHFILLYSSSTFWASLWQS